MKKFLIALLLLFASTSYAAVGGESLVNVEDTTAPTGVVQANRVKDAGTLSADGVTNGIIAAGGLVFDSGTSNWDRLYGDKTNGVWVNIKNSVALTFAGNHTPADTYTNPTDAINSFSLLGGWNGTTWDRVHILGDNADGLATSSTGHLAILAHSLIFNGTTWDRQRESINTGQALVDNSSNAVSNPTTNTTTVVKATGGVLNAVFINTAGAATATATFYNIASAGCSGTPASGFEFTLGTGTVGQLLTINHTFPLGICVVTATGGAAANISILYR